MHWRITDASIHRICSSKLQSKEVIDFTRLHGGSYTHKPSTCSPGRLWRKYSPHGEEIMMKIVTQENAWDVPDFKVTLLLMGVSTSSRLGLPGRSVTWTPVCSTRGRQEGWRILGWECWDLKGKGDGSSEHQFRIRTLWRGFSWRIRDNCFHQVGRQEERESRTFQSEQTAERHARPTLDLCRKARGKDITSNRRYLNAVSKGE